jgi:hypothetical protein
MSDLTRAQIISAAEEEAEAVGSSRWSTTLKLQRLDFVFAQEWRKILAANPLYRWALRTVSADSGARIAFTALDSGANDALERFHKVLALGRDNTLYEPASFLDDPMATVDGRGLYRWWPQGDAIQLPEADASASMRVWVSHTPQRPSQLSADNVVVTFPRGHEGVLVYELAALLLAKGGAETDLALELKAIAAGMRLEMLDEIGRRVVGPQLIAPSDHDGGWGAR